MATVGQQLRQAREAEHLEISEVADSTKIRSDHIRSLEEGNYSVFSAPVYIRGFVRSYATLLKLDAPKILEQLNLELAQSGQKEPSLSQPSHGFVDAVMFQLSKFGRQLAVPAVSILIIMVGCAAGYMIWLHYQNQDPLTGLGPGLYQGQLAADTLPLPR